MTAPRPMSGPAGRPARRAVDGCRVQRLSLRSGSVEEARAFGGRLFYPRRFLHPLQPSERLTARFNVLRLGPLTIGDMQYGADVTLGYEHPDAYQVGVPLAGRLEAHQGGRAILDAGSQAAVFRVGEDVVLDRWSASCRRCSTRRSGCPSSYPPSSTSPPAWAVAGRP
jgi:hypothetical protein